MPSTPEAQASNEERGLIRYANPADPTGPMLNTLKEVQEITKSMAKPPHNNQNPNPPKTKRTRTTKKP